MSKKSKKHEDPDFWESKGGYIAISKMRTGHLINTIKLINKLYESDTIEDYPIQYDNLYLELNRRGFDTDLELDSYYPSLDSDDEKES